MLHTIKYVSIKKSNETQIYVFIHECVKVCVRMCVYV